MQKDVVFQYICSVVNSTKTFFILLTFTMLSRPPCGMHFSHFLCARNILVNVWLDLMHTKLNRFTSTHLSFSINPISVSHGSTVLWFALWGAQILKRRFCNLEVMDRKITVLSIYITKPSLILHTLASQAVRPFSIDAFFSLSSAEEDSTWRQIKRFFYSRDR